MIEISIPSSVTSIGEKSFKNCRSLKEMIIPSSVEKIGDSFITGCTSLEKVIIPNSVTNIGRLDFADFAYLTEFIIPSSVEKIDEYAFSQCTSLIKIIIPSSVINIYTFAFNKCSLLRTITIPNSVISIEDNTFDGCSSLVEINIPSTITSIGFNAFKDCASLVNLTIPSSVKSIGYNAFEGCKMLKKVIYENDKSNLEIIFKKCILGPSNAGKTCILERYIIGYLTYLFLNSVSPTSYSKIIDIMGNEVELLIWDTAGQERFRSLNEVFYRGTEGFVAVFDLSDRKAFDEFKEMLNKFFKSNKPMASILIGNKSDLNHAISNEDIEQLKSEYNLNYFEVSGINHSNVDEAFNYLVNEIVKGDIEEKNRLEKLIAYTGKKNNIF